MLLPLLPASASASAGLSCVGPASAGDAWLSYLKVGVVLPPVANFTVGDLELELRDGSFTAQVPDCDLGWHKPLEAAHCVG
eukprot:scaffold415_cov362-Prasinococcus_capsulatus_cf.AAC.17